MERKFIKPGIILLIVAFLVVSLNVGAETGNSRVAQNSLTSSQQAFIDEILPAAEDGYRDG
ncbi:hypothetical protein IA712_15025, partial [Listeria seeligeri]|nr:hypothetical protein [Listeria seeligeri]